MTWEEDRNHPFAGIADKLDRSRENVVNLSSEISAFFEGCKYPVIPGVDSQDWGDAVDYHRRLTFPLRWGVLSGEIVHHLRSCLDHIVWHFSSAEYRLTSENAIAFPILKDEPSAKDKPAQYDRKIKGIANTNVLSLIEGMQPYKRGSDAEDDPLCIVHDMDRFDKHRELAIVRPQANLAFPPGTSVDAVHAVARYGRGEPLTDAERVLARRTIKNDAVVLPQVAFAEFGRRKDHPVIPSLSQLHQAIIERIDFFAREV